MRTFILSILSLLLVGCAATGARFDSVVSTPDDMSVIYFYRPVAHYGSALSFSVMDNGEEAFRIQNGQYFRYLTKPGEHNLVTDTSMIDKEMNIRLDPGETYFVRVDVNSGMWTATIRLNKAYSDQAIDQMKSCCRSGS